MCPDLPGLVASSFESKVAALLQEPVESQLKPLATFLASLTQCLTEKTHPLAPLVSNTLALAADLLRQSDSARSNLVLLGFVKSCWSQCLPLLSESALLSLDNLMRDSVPSFVLEQKDLSLPALDLFQQYLVNRKDTQACNAAWEALVGVLPAVESERMWSILDPLVKLSTADGFPAGMENANLDHFMRDYVNNTVLSENSGHLLEKQAVSLAELLVSPGSCVSTLSARLNTDQVPSLKRACQQRFSSCLHIKSNRGSTQC
jgi:hypothetical protein